MENGRVTSWCIILSYGSFSAGVLWVRYGYSVGILAIFAIAAIILSGYVSSIQAK